MARAIEHPSENPIGPMQRHGPFTAHAAADSPGQPHLAGAQIPGPGAGRLLAGQDGRLPDDAADPLEREGHLPGARGFLSRLTRRR
ncbi:hypothetical protein ACQ3I4_05830 [Zafaria sp. Z1313]|uniref:hypothetical protein n=1 Tax=unclassified Zafaria TaxID=2828765 RepID=UPI002E7A0DB3|nr:hypothetical protein [Zafaria sp. J156]MEE1622503.1 hypothetical protein [Zafaria sp. J156]